MMSADWNDIERSIRMDDTVALDTWLSSGNDVNGFYGSLSPLMLACHSGAAVCVRRLLDEGADTSLADRDRRGPLHCLLERSRGCDGESAAILRMLLDAGADVNAKDIGGYSPMYWAVNNSTVECCKMLLEAGADVRVNFRNGDSLFHVAAARATDPEIIILLAGAGLDPLAVNATGESACVVALHRGAPAEILDAFRSVAPQDVMGGGDGPHMVPQEVGVALAQPGPGGDGVDRVAVNGQQQPEGAVNPSVPSLTYGGEDDDEDNADGAGIGLAFEQKLRGVLLATGLDEEIGELLIQHKISLRDFVKFLGTDGQIRRDLLQRLGITTDDEMKIEALEQCIKQAYSTEFSGEQKAGKNPNHAQTFNIMDAANCVANCRRTLRSWNTIEVKAYREEFQLVDQGPETSIYVRGNHVIPARNVAHAVRVAKENASDLMDAIAHCKRVMARKYPDSFEKHIDLFVEDQDRSETRCVNPLLTHLLLGGLAAAAVAFLVKKLRA